jgi:hypothetical protein
MGAMKKWGSSLCLNKDWETSTVGKIKARIGLQQQEQQEIKKSKAYSITTYLPVGYV